jgi:hypothetical protein
VVLVTSNAVPVFTTKQDSIAPSVGNRLAILKPDARVPVLDCLDAGSYSIYKIRLSDGQMGFVNGGDYTLTNSNYSDSVWCGAKPRNPQWERGWVTDCVGPEFSKSAVNGATGPGSERPVFKINRQLVVAVPKRYWPNAGSLGHEPRTCTMLSDLPTAEHLYFYLQGNWSSGYDPREVPIANGVKQFRPDFVTVRIERAQPETRSAGDLAKMREISADALRENSIGTRTFGSLTCFVPKPAAVFYSCSGHRSQTDAEIINLRFRDYTDTSFLLVQANYVSPRYGGIQVYWNAWILDPSHASEIDAAIWKLIEDWNLLNKTEVRPEPR